MKLNLGARNTRIKGFVNVDINPGKNIDIVGDVSNLSQFKDGSISEIYASHILEHFSHTKTEKVLKEWYRVLKPESKLYLGVPNLEMAVKLYNKYQMSFEWLIYYLYGDQSSKYDYHYTIFTYADLLFLLNKVGFKKINKIINLPYKLKDASALVFTLTNEPISLNIECYK